MEDCGEFRKELKIDLRKNWDDLCEFTDLTKLLFLLLILLWLYLLTTPSL